MGNLIPGMTYIYESPDGGKTIRQRTFGDLLTSTTYSSNDVRDKMREDQLWYNIRQAAKDNPALQEVLEQAIIIYTLGKKE